MAEFSRRGFLGASGAAALAAAQSAPTSDRDYWIATLRRIAGPVLTALSRRQLSATMPVEAPHGNAAERRLYTHLEAFGRVLAGIAPWLESGGEDAALAREAMTAAVDPASPDYMNFSRGSQPLVDAAFLALGILRAPAELWQKLDARTREHVLAALRSTRAIRPYFNNWLLFSATIEAFLGWAGEQWDATRIDYAVRQHEEWYKGDGAYGDGPEFHWDYYNSFVIHPMLLAVVEAVKGWEEFRPKIVARASRYAAVQERLIAPDGSFPPLGRSLAYRCGAFHLLAAMALRDRLPVRAALTAVIRRTIDAPGTFDDHGWLRIGLCGHQRSIAEPYISTGSLYLCTAAFLPLGLPATDPFWTSPAQDWTSKKAWSGHDVPADHAL